MIRLVYETHSTTLDNEAGIATGWLPGELSADGRRQAELLGERRRDDGIDAVFSSDLRRAVQTVEVAFAGTDVPRRQDVRMADRLGVRPPSRLAAQLSGTTFSSSPTLTLTSAFRPSGTSTAFCLGSLHAPPSMR